MGADVCSERGVQAVLRVRAVGVGSPENGQITVVDDLAAFAQQVIVERSLWITAEFCLQSLGQGTPHCGRVQFRHPGNGRLQAG